jgi:hypothetical protein
MSAKMSETSEALRAKTRAAMAEIDREPDRVS